MRNSRSFLLLTLLGGLIGYGQVSAVAGKERPNVLFIIVDDLNTLPYQPEGKPLVATPNIDRLKAKGVTFTNAHTNDPLCAPARASMMFGLYPQTTSLYWFENWRDNGIYRESVPLERNLVAGGYHTLGTGKIYHSRETGEFLETGPGYSFGPWPWDGREETVNGYNRHPQQTFLYEGPDADMDFQWEHVFGSLDKVPSWPADPANGVPGYTGWTLGGKPWRYESSDDRDLMPDETIAAWVEQVLQRDHDKPFALFAGLVKTHTPLYAPQEYFDRFPLESIVLPEVDPDDLDDVSPTLGNQKLYGFRRYQMLVRHEERDLLRQWLQAYLACVSFIDDQVGTILDALEASAYGDNTVVVFTSDHGFHVGEKNFLYKGSLWEPSTNIPLILAGVPGAPTGETSNHPVSLIDLYPTLNELCGLDRDPNRDGNGYQLEGHSLVPLALNPRDPNWAGPDVAITTIPGKNHTQKQVYEGTWFPHFSVRSQRYRYSLTSNGEEELYDHQEDPHEWTNLANNPAHESIKQTMREQLIALRDGDRWEDLDLSADHASVARYTHFELELEVKVEQGRGFAIHYRDGSNDQISMPAAESVAARHGDVRPGAWNRYRIRVHNNRHQLWINQRVVSDEVGEDDRFEAGKIRISSSVAGSPIEIRGARIRRL